MRSGSVSTSRMPPDAESRLPLKSRVPRLLSYVRLDEVLVLQGSPWLGAAFAAGRFSWVQAPRLALFAAASLLLVGHIFVLNDWSERSRHARRSNGAAGVGGSSAQPREMARLWAWLLASSALLFGCLGLRPLSIALSIAVLSALYSLPACHAKGLPVVSSLLHFSGGLLHFLLGYSVFRPIDRRGLEIAIFFALTFAAGHLTQEVGDHSADLAHGIRTNAVHFGRRRAFLAALVVFGLADAWLAGLAIRGVVPWVLVLGAGLAPLHLLLASQALRADLSRSSILLLRGRYRVLYALLGVLMVLALQAQRT